MKNLKYSMIRILITLISLSAFSSENSEEAVVVVQPIISNAENTAHAFFVNIKTDNSTLDIELITNQCGNQTQMFSSLGVSNVYLQCPAVKAVAQCQSFPACNTNNSD